MKRNIWYILLTMTVAILGVLVFQIYWISNTYDVQDKAFKQEVNLALEQVLNQNIASKTLNQVFGRELSSKDSVVLGGGEDMELEWKYEEYYEEEHWVIQSDNGLMTVKPSELLQVFGSAMIRIVQNRPDLKEVQNQYAQELSDRGIGVKFALAYAKQDQLIESTGDDPGVFGDAQVVQNIPGRQDDEYILAFFSSTGSFILKRMWLTLLGSFLLFSLITGSFILMLQTILKQKRVSEIKNDFINNMTHEFKTPISTVSAAMEALVSFEGLSDKERSLRYIDISRNEIKRLGSLVEKVLSLSVFEKKKITLNKDTFDLCKLLHDTSQPYILKGEGNVQIEIESASGAYIHADRLHFQNVINNLIDNAVKYSEPPAMIQMSCQREGDYFILKVKDQGIGISKEQQKHIFEKFYRVPTGDLHGVKGFGLGLSYVKQIVESHGGTIGVKSQPGIGSEFTIAIPDIDD